MKFYLAAIVVLATALPASAQSWYARGEFNSYGTTDPLTDLGGGQFIGTVTTPAANHNYQYKIGNFDFNQSAPPNNGVVTSNGSNEITFHFYDNTNWTDGWSPTNQRRVGYDDPGLYGWEVMSSIDNFTNGLALTNQGNGLYSGTFNLPAGNYDFKFREQGSWDINMGKDFSNGSDNNSIHVWSANQPWTFSLDLPNGRWQAMTTTSPDRNLDQHIDARDFVSYRKNDGSAANYSTYRQNFNYSPWFMRGDYNSFGYGNPMTYVKDGEWAGTISGLNPGQVYEYKIANLDFSQSSPGSNGKVPADANGQIKYHLYEAPGGSFNDGWSPDNKNRVGYDDPHQFGWEVVGDFDNYGAGTPVTLTDQGNGLYTGQFAMTGVTPGDHTFKFRKQGTYDISIGDDFGNSAADNHFTTASDGQIWSFALDLPNGRWRAYAATSSALTLSQVPEPASVALAMFGLALLGFRKRK